jgi:hypothetical protein
MSEAARISRTSKNHDRSREEAGTNAASPASRPEMKAIDTVLHLRTQKPLRLRHMVPTQLWRFTLSCGIKPKSNERSACNQETLAIP